MHQKLMFAVSLFVATVVFAGDPELKPAQEEGKEQFDESVGKALKSLNEKCGTKLTAVKTDFHNFKPEEWSGMAFYSWCDPVVEAITTLCDRPAYKKAIAKKLTGIQCLFSGVKPAQKDDGSNEGTLRNMSFEKGQFIFRMSKDSANVSDNAKAVMEKALN
ncbi:MAG: hypothetical protein JNJ54_29855 [Myxococcaceae bacterium]|nr:hypothetical protein [Myxococcaceae bacterium]